MSMFNKFAVMIAFVVCTTNAWAADVMKNDPNAIGILDCVIGKAAGWEEENYDCSAKHKSWSHNYHSTKAVCKKFVADAYYNKYKDNTGMTGRDWPDIVGKLPELIDGKYMLRCVATECDDGYELARDKNGNSQGWCREKKSAPAPVLADGGCMFTFDDGTVVGPASNVHMITNDPEKWSSIVTIELYDDEFNLLDTKKPGTNCRMLKKIGNVDISPYIPEGTLGISEASCHAVKIEYCDESKGYYYFAGIADEPEPIYTPTNPQIKIRNLCVKKDGGKATQEETEKSDDVFAKIDVDLNKYFSKSSVWKKEDGSFNTARLASDSIAGVVLGTTGGIITSNVIKKNQIKKGFEDLKCTIGGQSVAAYGDEFSVGVK